MREVTRRIVTALLGLIGVGAGWADEESTPPVAASPQPSLAQTLQATSSARQPLNLLLTQSELRSVIREYENKTGEVHTAPIDDDEVVVTAPRILAPMRDPSQDVGAGIFAPFWAIMNPGNAWRIFVPIPPKGPPRDPEPPAPDPR